MTAPKDKPREFWIGETDTMYHVAESWLETQDWDFDVVHVIEYSAYEALQKEQALRESCYKNNEDEFLKLEKQMQAENEILKNCLNIAGQQLQHEIEGLKKCLVQAQNASIELGQENDRLREALEFYADPTNWNMCHRKDIDKLVPSNSEGSSEIEKDQGNLARIALEEKT